MNLLMMAGFCVDASNDNYYGIEYLVSPSTPVPENWPRDREGSPVPLGYLSAFGCLTATVGPDLAGHYENAWKDYKIHICEDQ